MIKKLQALKAKKGFTLVELIVVIAIIGVLAAILVPTMMNVVTKARVSSEDQTAKSVSDTVTEWLADLEANRGTIKNGTLAITGIGGSTVSVTALADGTAANVATGTSDGTLYTRGGSDATPLLADTIQENYVANTTAIAVVYIQGKHVVGVVYSDDVAAVGDLPAINATNFTDATPGFTWESASKEGIMASTGTLVGTNPKLLYKT